MRIVIDDREPSEFLEEFFNAGIDNIDIERLAVGDIVIGEYVIERKTTRDFWASVCDGRLTEQASNMLDLIPLGKKPVYIIEDADPMDIETEYKVRMMEQSWNFKFPVFHTKSMALTVSLIYHIYEKHEAGELDYIPRGVRKGHALGPEITLYASLPGVGVDRGKLLSEAFSSPSEFVLAVIDTAEYNKERWKTKALWRKEKWNNRAKGIGLVTATKVEQLILEGGKDVGKRIIKVHRKRRPN